MSQVPPEIMNIVRRDMHASDTIISANHPDVKPPQPSPEASEPDDSESPLKRFVGRFTLTATKAETEEP